jgi:hypothetical protein
MRGIVNLEVVCEKVNMKEVVVWIGIRVRQSIDDIEEKYSYQMDNRLWLGEPVLKDDLKATNGRRCAIAVNQSG